MLLLLALLPALVSVLLFLGTVRQEPSSRRSAPQIIDSTPISATTRPDPGAVARSLGAVPDPRPRPRHPSPRGLVVRPASPSWQTPRRSESLLVRRGTGAKCVAGFVRPVAHCESGAFVAGTADVASGPSASPCGDFLRSRAEPTKIGSPHIFVGVVLSNRRDHRRRFDRRATRTARAPRAPSRAKKPKPKRNVASPSETNGDGCDVFSASDDLAFGAA